MARFNGWVVGRSLTGEEADALEPYLDLLTEALEARRNFVERPLKSDPAELVRQAWHDIQKSEVLIEAGVNEDYGLLRDKYVALATLALMHVENIDRELRAKQIVGDHNPSPLGGA